MNIPDKFIFGLTNTEYRPCYLVTHTRKGNEVKTKALFHKWTLIENPVRPSYLEGGHLGGQLSRPLAILELEDGSIGLVEPESVQFIDTKELMDQIAWNEEDSAEKLTEGEKDNEPKE